MKKIKKAVLFLNYPQEEINRIAETLDAEEVVICTIQDGKKIYEEIVGAEVLMISYPLMNIEDYDISSLRWLHADMAGLDLIYTPTLAAREDLIVTSGNGRSSHALAEHALMFMLNLAYSFSTVYNAQKESKWITSLPNYAMTLFGKSVAIFGVGSVGSEIANRCKAFGMNVYGYLREKEELRAPYDKFFVGENGMKELLSLADFIIISMPLTDETYHTFDKKEFDMMKDTVYIINMSRGPILNEATLIEELKNKRILGFAADSFEKEPLKADSELWSLDNVLITPHLTPSQPGKQTYMTSLIIENINAYKTNGQLKNPLKPFYAYSGPSRYDFDLGSKLMQKYMKKGEKNAK